MEQHPEHNPGQGKHPAAGSAASTGSILRAAREKLGLTVTEVAGQIKFAPRQIEALEADDYGNLPEVAFLRGFVRSYAKILRLDAEALLANLPPAKAAIPELPQTAVKMPFPSDQSDRQQNLIWLTAAAVLALIVAGFSYWHFKTPLKHSKEQTRESSREMSAASPPADLLPADLTQAQPKEPSEEPVREQSKNPEETPEAAPPKVSKLPSARMLAEPLVLKSSTIEPITPKLRSSTAASSVREAKTQAKRSKAKAAALAAASSVAASDTLPSSDAMAETAELLLIFGEESWTEIKDKDGKILSSQVNPPGSELRVEGNPPFSMLIGHAASASLFYQGREVDLKPYINQYSEVAHLKLK